MRDNMLDVSERDVRSRRRMSNREQETMIADDRQGKWERVLYVVEAQLFINVW